MAVSVVVPAKFVSCRVEPSASNSWYDVTPEIRLLMRLPYCCGSFVYTTLIVFVASDSARRFCSSQM
jgi:hypothetical protein